MPSKKIDITDAVRVHHELELIGEIIAEIRASVSTESFQSDQDAVDKLLGRKSAMDNTSEDTNVVFFDFSAARTVGRSVGRTQLLAASGVNLGDCFSQPLIFSSIGVQLDVRQILGEDGMYDVELTPFPSGSSDMAAAFSDWASESVKLVVEMDNEPLLLCDLYVDESALEAQGTGYLNPEIGSLPATGSLSIKVID